MSRIGHFLSRLLPSGHDHVLGMNRRNLSYIYPNNMRRDFPLADDKLQTKTVLAAAGVPMPETYFSYGYFFDLKNLNRDLSSLTDFVIKPAQGSGGGGIIVIADKRGDRWVSAGGTIHTLDGIRSQITDILFGVYSFGLSDHAVVEERIAQHEQMDVLSPFGLADIRLILLHGEPILAMARVPTRASDGKANLHQGAVGIGIDLQKGVTTHGIMEGNAVTHHPDTGEQLLGRSLPHWDETMAVGRRAARAVPLKYLGVDISLAARGPVVLEINVRPGLQIQNANATGMLPLLMEVGS